MSTITEEEENYVRMSLLLCGISHCAARTFFNSEFAPSRLSEEFRRNSHKLNRLKAEKTLNKSQWNLLFPPGNKGDPDSKNFDVTLIIILLRNLAEMDIPDRNFNCLPLSTDTTPSADLATIKFYRNFIAHKADGKVESSYFNKAWDHITTVVGRLGGKNMLDECKELRTKIFEQSTVPWNIRVQINQLLETWKMNNSTFVETRAAKHVFECVQGNSCVTITASSGVGKTATLQNVILKMVGEGYDVLPVTNAHDIVRFYNPNKKTLFVMDDCCGIYSINQFDLHSLQSVMERLQVLIQNKLTKIIVACRLQVYQDEKFESLSIFRTCVCNLLSKDLRLSQPEKQLIAESYLDTNSTEIIQYCDLHDCFPLLCKLYNDNPELNITDFFKNPFSVYEAEIDKLHKNGNYGKFCALALCVMFNNGLKEIWLTNEIDKETKTKIKNTCEACKLDRGTPRLILLDELKTLENTFIKKDQGVYKIMHDKLFDFLSFYFGKKMIHCVIKNGDSDIIRQRFFLEKQNNMEQFITVVPLKYHNIFKKRLIDDWSKGKIQCVFNNINMKISKFRLQLLRHLKSLDISYQEKLALVCDVDSKDTVLIQCCQYDDIPWINWCIDHGEDVNTCNCDGVSPLIKAAEYGHTSVVKLLLTKEADINKSRNNRESPEINDIGDFFVDCLEKIGDCLNEKISNNPTDTKKCDDDGASALYMACKNNHIGTVKVLLDNNADINKFAASGSPFYIACKYNHKEIVMILMDSNVEINEKCTNGGATPLYIACENNCIDTVNILLDYQADINKCGNFETSPLYIACQNNHMKIVKILLNKNADLSKCSLDGYSPLFAACQNNYKEIVKVLLDNGADVDKCTDYGSSPLNAACCNNHTETVKILLDNNANINKCDNNGASPLYIACSYNHTETVKILVDNKANINKCDNNGSFPLHIACCNNHTETVKILLDNKADINKCDNKGATPLFTSCKINHIKTVQVLLDNKADINKYKDNGASPLYIACQNNNKEIVKVLLDKNADTNKCANNGASPLYIACQKNHKEIVILLLDKTADVNMCLRNGMSPLYVACKNNHIEIVNVLLDNNADINTCKDNGASPLHIACFYNNIEVVKLLLESGADINKCDNNGESPLHIASHNHHTEIVKLLEESRH